MPDRSPSPELLTVAEAARALGLRRSAAYARAQVWRETGGQAGLPTVTVGRSLRVPRAALERMLGHPVDRIPAAGAKHRESTRAQRGRDKNVSNEREHDDDKTNEIEDQNDDQQSNEQISDSIESSVQLISKRPVDICHPCGEAGPAPASPPPARAGWVWSRGC